VKSREAQISRFAIGIYIKPIPLRHLIRSVVSKILRVVFGDIGEAAISGQPDPFPIAGESSVKRRGMALSISDRDKLT
jgi:hypothetical protein